MWRGIPRKNTRFHAVRRSGQRRSGCLSGWLWRAPRLRIPGKMVPRGRHQLGLWMCRAHEIWCLCQGSIPQQMVAGNYGQELRSVFVKQISVHASFMHGNKVNSQGNLVVVLSLRAREKVQLTRLYQGNAIEKFLLHEFSSNLAQRILMCSRLAFWHKKWGSPTSFCCYGDRNIMPPRVEKNIILRFGIMIFWVFH